MSSADAIVTKNEVEDSAPAGPTKSNEAVVQSTNSTNAMKGPAAPMLEKRNPLVEPPTPSANVQTSDLIAANGTNEDAPAPTIAENPNDMQAVAQSAVAITQIDPECTIASEAAADNVIKLSPECQATIPAETKEENATTAIENERKRITGQEQTKEPLKGATEVSSMGAGDSCVLKKPDEKNGEHKLEVKQIPSTEVNKENVKLKPEKNSTKTSNEELLIEKLKQALKKTMEDRDSYRDRLEGAEKKFAILQQSYDAIAKGDEDTLRRTVDQLRAKLIQTSLQLEDRNRLLANQERQINALNSQVSSLKEVETLTRSLLQIRNMEVKHLQTEVDDMEVRITEERDRYNSMIQKMDAAVQLNGDLKKEYETQLSLFRDLREKYEEKVNLLSAEKEALENVTRSNA